MGILGIDVSHHNGLIDWKKVKENSNIKFMIAKVQYESLGHRIDEFFERNYNGAGSNSIKRGAYVYIGQQTILDVDDDADCFLKKVSGKNLECGVWLDIEDAALKKISKSELEYLIMRYANKIESAGYGVGIYCNYYFYKSILPESVKTLFPFWIARYPLIDTGVLNIDSIIKPCGSNVNSWQYSQRGKIQGINGYVDLDYNFNGDIEKIMIRQNPYPEPTQTLRYSCRSDEVKWLQFELIKNNYNPGLIDGVFGSKTLSAVIGFQKYSIYNLDVDGIVGPFTLQALLSEKSKRN